MRVVRLQIAQKGFHDEVEQVGETEAGCGGVECGRYVLKKNGTSNTFGAVIFCRALVVSYRSQRAEQS
jgi:hypothetical protein